MNPIFREMNDRFKANQIKNATELQNMPFERVLEELRSSLKLLISYRSKPEAVLLDQTLFAALISRIEELEEALEDTELGSIASSRDSSDAQWVDEDAFKKALKEDRPKSDTES